MPSPRSILTILKHRARNHPNRRAFVALAGDGASEIVWTYRDLFERAAAVARSLRAAAPAGERVLLLLPGGLAFLQAFLGCLLAGCIPVPLPPFQHRRHLERIRRVQRDCLAVLAIAWEQRPAASGDEEDLPALLGVRCVSVEELEAHGPGGRAASRHSGPASGRGTIAFLQYTSGSTGDPKGAIVTHAGILANQESIQQCFAHDERSIVVGWLPLFHDMGLIGNILQSIYCGIPCVLLPTAGVLQNPMLWLRAIATYRATTSGGPDFMYALCARRARPEDLSGLDLSSWQVAFNGSEPIRAETLADFTRVFAPRGFRASAFLPCYGLAEATLLVTGQAAGRGARVAWADRQELTRGHFRHGAPARPASAPLVGSGTTWGDTRVEIVDPESGEVLPPDRVGEVIVQGRSVVPGYWGLRNGSSSIVDGVDGRSRVLRTGDLAFLNRGDLFVVGRSKDTLIVRGRNIHAADLESVAQAAHARLYGRRAAVFATEEEGAEAIVLVHEASKGQTSEGAAICDALAIRLAEEFGVAPDVVLLTRPGMIPVTTSGKVQRGVCRAQVAAGELPIWYEWRKSLDGDTLTAALVAALADPETGLPRLRALLPSGADTSTSLLSLGIDSVQVLSLGHAIEKRTGIRLPWESFAEASFDGLREALASRLAVPVIDAPTIDAPTITPSSNGRRDPADDRHEDHGPAPLSPGQLSLWYLHLLAPSNRYWHLARSLHLEGAVDRHALIQTIESIVARHPSLRATLAQDRGEWVQRDLPLAGGWTLLVDGRAISAAVAERVARTAAARPFTPEGGALFRAVCIDLGGSVIVQLAIHHLAADFWSINLVLRELLETYARLREGLPARLAPISGRYASFARQQAALARADGGGSSRAYWQSSASGDAPVARIGPESRAARPGGLRTSGHILTVPRATAAGVRRLGRAEGRTAQSVLLAAFQVLVARLAGTPRSLIGTVLSGRATAEWSTVAGCFAQVAPLRVDVTDDPPFRTLLGRVSDDVRAAMSHQAAPIDLPGPQAPGQALPQAPFDIVFVYQGASAGMPALTASLAVGAAGPVEQIGALRVRPLASSHAVPQFPLTFTVADRGDGFLVHVSARVDSCSPETARSLGEHFVTLLREAVEAPHVRVSELECWPAAAVVPARADRGLSWPAGHTLHDAFRKIAAAMPDRVAVSAEQQITYGVLDRESDRLAERIPAGQPIVGLFVGSTSSIAVAVLGILKSGAAYLPLATTWPLDYVARVLGSAGVTAVVTDRRDRLELPDGIRAIDVENRGERDPHAASASHGARAGDIARSVAYLIHTSGSTGDPKAVSVSHGHVLRLLTVTRGLFDFTCSDVWTLFHAISFDFSVWELWGALAFGGRLEIPSHELSRDPAAFHAFLIDRQVTILNQTPTAFGSLQRSLVEAGTGAIRSVIFGGEKLDPGLLRPSFATGGPRPDFVNMYGITETTVHVTFHRITEADVMHGAASVIGRPLADLQTQILTPALRRVPVGGIGEIYVGGNGVANGYWRRPEATAERFVPDPFATAAGARLYRTGDLARLLPGGTLAFVGRRDTQVKVRGHRIELGAIESCIRQQGGVSEVVVLFVPPRERHGVLQLADTAVSGRTAGGPPVREFLSRAESAPADTGMICAFVARDPAHRHPLAALRASAARALPNYMRPARWVLLDRLPRTVNGKVDARALLAMIPERPELDEALVLPRTPLESTLAEIWSAALGVRLVGIDDNLFELGCDSIRSLRIVGLARERGVNVTLAQLLDAQTIRALTEAIGEQQTPPQMPSGEARAAVAATAAAAPPLPDGAIEVYPLARLQEGILYHCAIDPDPALYRDVFLYHFRLPLDVEALKQCLRDVTHRHPVLRSSIDLVSFAEPMQLIHRDVQPDFCVVDDWRGGDVEPPQALLRWAEAERRRALSTHRPPPLRFFALPDGETFHLALSFHDALLDGWSASLLVGDIVQRYQHALDGAPLPLEPLPRVSFREFVEAERDELRRQEPRAFWRRALEGHTPCLVGAGGMASRGKLAVVRVPIDRALSEQLIAFANTIKAPLKNALLAVHLRVLANWLGKERVVTGLESNGRLEVAGADECLGMHLNTLPFAADLGRGSWADLVRAVFGAERALWPFRRFPLTEIMKGWGRGEIFDSVFNFTHFHHLRALESLPRLQVLGARGLGSTHYALRAEFNRDPFRDLLQLDLEIDMGRFTPSGREALIAAYGGALRALVEHEGARPHHHFAPEWRAAESAIAGPDLPPPDDAVETMREAFDRFVLTQPDAVALMSERASLTYDGLDRAASAIAHRLRARGIGRGERVGICVSQSAEAIAAMFAAMKMSCAYVPLDPAAPPDRLALVVQEARLACVIADRVRVDPDTLSASCRCGLLTLPLDSRETMADAPLFISEGLSPHDVAYVIFTSGSTGAPKGVPVTHRNLWTSLRARASQYPETPETFLLLSPLFFDSSVAVVFGALSRGGAVAIPPSEVPREPGLIADWIGSRQVTHLLALPRVYAALLEAARPPSLATLRRVIVAGEACQPAHVLHHFRVLPGVALTNEYGPTESTVWSTAFDCREYGGQTTVPIGRPVAGLTVRLLGPGMQAVRPGGDGEIYLSGPAVASHYAFQPLLTAKLFVPDPFSTEPGGRLYRTGDRARLLPGGDLEFLGRVDRQIKIRGHRVEPSEIEAVLMACAGVAEACVSLDPVTHQLAAFVVSIGGRALADEHVREHAARWLPEHMRPRRIHAVDALPRTANGKIDLGRLERAGAGSDAPAYVRKG